MTETLPILYSFRRCPYAMRARLALYTAKISHEHREVDLKHKPPQMLAISPKGTVPVLQLADTTVLEQSLDIMKWALKDHHLSEKDAQLITENDTTFKHALDRYKYPGRYPDETGANYREFCRVFLDKLEALLNPFLTGTTVTILDMAIFPFIRQFAQVDPKWFEEQDYQRLKEWLNSLASSPLFEQIMQEYPIWSSGNAPTLVVF
ncbi:MAG: glutathione S-transferase [Alphaproteobacteria bacterium]